MAGISGKRWARRKVRRFVRHMQETWQNKLAAIVFVLAGLTPAILDKDGTALILALIFAIPLFFSKESWMY